MKIRLTDIPAQGLHVVTTLSLESLNTRLTTGESHGILFTAAPEVDLTVFKDPSGAETKGTVRTRYRQPCSLCAKELERDMELSTNFYLRPKPENISDDDAEVLLDDIDVVYYEGDHVDLEDAIQESLIISLSIYWQPPRDENEKCTICHLSFREIQGKAEEAPKPKAQVLGDLLKKAGVH